MHIDGKKAKVAVTGATGLVGSHLVQQLVNSGHYVLAMIRSQANAQDLIELANNSHGQLKVVVVDVGDAAALKANFAGIEVVVHAAGRVDPYGSREEILATNFGGTKNALAAAKLVDVRQFIYVSSLSVITGQGDQYDVDEEAPLRLCGESYADSKVEAEQLVMSEVTGGLIKVTSLRPGFIYGPKERSWLPRIINSIATGQARLVDGGTKETNVIYIGNLVNAIEAAILNSKTFGQVYNLTDGEKVTKKQLFDTISAGLGLPYVTRTVPSLVYRGVCEVVSTFAPALPVKQQKNLAKFSRAAYRLAAVNQGFSIKKAERDLNYVNRIPFKKGMEMTLPYFKSLVGPGGQFVPAPPSSVSEGTPS